MSKSYEKNQKSHTTLIYHQQTIRVYNFIFTSGQRHRWAISLQIIQNINGYKVSAIM